MHHHGPARHRPYLGLVNRSLPDPGGALTRVTDPDERVVAIDVLRGFALFGVMAVNLVTEFRVSIFEQFVAGPSASRADRLASAFVEIALQSKALTLFSFLFGVSLAILYERLDATGRPLYWLSRRLAVLLAFGVVHLVFVWNGDILTEYAIAGFVVLPLLAAPTRVIASVAAALLVLFVAVPFPPVPPLWPTPEALRTHVAAANLVYGSGGLLEIWRFSVREIPLLVPLHVFVFARTLALFLLGVLAWRCGVFEGSTQAVRRLAWIGLAGCVAGAALTVAEHAGVRLDIHTLGPFSDALSRLAPVIFAAGYGAAVIAYVQSRANRTVLIRLAPLGRMAFTNYLLESVIFGLIFFGYGLGYFGRLGAFAGFLLGLTVFASQGVLSALWLRRYRYGPFEWLWRSLMYGRAQPLRRH